MQQGVRRASNPRIGSCQSTDSQSVAEDLHGFLTQNPVLVLPQLPHFQRVVHYFYATRVYIRPKLPFFHHFWLSMFPGTVLPSGPRFQRAVYCFYTNWECSGKFAVRKSRTEIKTKRCGICWNRTNSFPSSAERAHQLRQESKPGFLSPGNPGTFDRSPVKEAHFIL